MEVTPELLQQFFNGECSARQGQEIRHWLLQHPEILEQYLTEENWNSFEHGPVAAGISDRMRKHISKKIRPAVPYRRWMMAAASVLILFSIAGLLLKKKPVLPAEKSLAVVAPPRKLIRDTSFVTETIKLPDGTIVSLMPGSSVCFASVFGARRDVDLVGCASFAVAKDHTKPFCVHAKNINVTALGTVFTVDDRNKITKVRLHEGKVVVQKEPKVQKNMVPVFLTPGQELQFDNIHFSDKVRLFIKKEPGKIKPAAPVQVPAINVVIRFDNEPMLTVLQQLEAQCHVKITVNETALKEMRFTGTYKSSKETVDQFLNTLALLNHLKIDKTKTGFLIQPDE
ncbi:MAG: FecR family protein [Niabella sp.]|nr:FecR family protein [Niabella sp.]